MNLVWHLLKLILQFCWSYFKRWTKCASFRLGKLSVWFELRKIFSIWLICVLSYSLLVCNQLLKIRCLFIFILIAILRLIRFLCKLKLHKIGLLIGFYIICIKDFFFLCWIRLLRVRFCFLLKFRLYISWWCFLIFKSSNVFVNFFFNTLIYHWMFVFIIVCYVMFEGGCSLSYCSHARWAAPKSTNKPVVVAKFICGHSLWYIWRRVNILVRCLLFDWYLLLYFIHLNICLTLFL